MNRFDTSQEQGMSQEQIRRAATTEVSTAADGGHGAHPNQFALLR